MNPGPRSQWRQCKKYCKATDKVVKCQECSKCFHVSCANLSEKELGSEKETWYYKDCKAEFGLCSDDVLNNHKAVQCDKINVKCGFTMTALSTLISSMKPCKIQAVPGFVQNVNFSISLTHSFLSN